MMTPTANKMLQVRRKMAHINYRIRAERVTLIRASDDSEREKVYARIHALVGQHNQGMLELYSLEQ